MARWEPNTQERLILAALDLYTERGYDATTIGDIAGRVGVTSRTYFRYFPDKREVLFAQRELHAAVVAGTAAALETQRPFDAIVTGITGSEPAFQARDFVRRRAAVIVTSDELQERELMKTAGMTADLRARIVAAGADPATARLVAEAGVAVFVEATRRWTDDETTPFAELVQQAVHVLRATVTE